MKRKDKSLLWYCLGCAAFYSAGFFACMTFKVNHDHVRNGEITVYGINGIVAHFDDAEYERVKDMVIVYDGDTELRYINCNVEVKE